MKIKVEFDKKGLIIALIAIFIAALILFFIIYSAKIPKTREELLTVRQSLAVFLFKTIDFLMIFCYT